MFAKAAIGLLFLSLASVVYTNEVSDDFLLRKAAQEIDLRRHYTDITTTLELEALRNVNEAVVCGIWMIWNNAAHLVITSGASTTVKPLRTSLKELEGVPEGVGCMSAELPKSVSIGDTITLKIIGTFTKLLTPYPKAIRQSEKQKVAFESSVLVPSPYRAKEQTTKVLLPSGGSILSMTSGGQQDGDKLMYGPFQDVQPLSMEPLRLHYVHNKPYAHATKVVKEIQISLWGNVYVEEIYHLVNDGAQSSGGWSRLQYQKNTQKYPNVLRSFLNNGGSSEIPLRFAWSSQETIAVLPRTAHSLYFKDEIGNISTSRVRVTEKNVVAVLEPRYPLQKGWRTIFTFGYSLPLESTLRLIHPGQFQMLTTFGPSIQDLSVDDFEIQVVFPEGSSGIDYQLPFSAKMSFGKKFWYFDTIGRPVLKAQHTNIVPRHNVRFSVNFNARMSVLWRKPMYFITIVSLVFGVCMLLNRLEVGISNQKHSKRSHSWTPEMTAELERILRDRQRIVNHMLGGIEAASTTRTLTQPTAIKAAADEQILATNKKLTDFCMNLVRTLTVETSMKLEALTAVMAKPNSSTKAMLDGCLSKEMDLMTRASNLLAASIEDLKKRTVKKKAARAHAIDKTKILRELADWEDELATLVEYLR